jgi:tetratricopeptide (TPR) repeat protein
MTIGRGCTLAPMTIVRRRRIVVDDSALAQRIGERLKAARKQAGMTQQQLAEGRYTKAYVSALEKGLAKPSMAALNFFSGRLGLPASRFLAEEVPAWTRLEADILLASGDFLEAADAFESLLPTVGTGILRAEVQRGRAEALCRLERGTDAIGPATEAADIYERLRRPRDWALASYWQAYAVSLAGNIGEARAILGSVLARLRDGLEVEPDFKARVLTAIAGLSTAESDFRGALAYLEEARATTADLDDRRRAAILYTLATTYRELGDLEAAIRIGTESLMLTRAAEIRVETAFLENDLALAYMAVGNLGRAEELATAADSRVGGDIGDRVRAHIVETRAQISLAAGDPERALTLLDECQVLAEASGNRKAFTSMLLTRAKSLWTLGRLDEATETYEQAATLVREYGPKTRLPQVLGEWADVLARLGRHEEAYALTREALQATSGG